MFVWNFQSCFNTQEHPVASHNHPITAVSHHHSTSKISISITNNCFFFIQISDASYQFENVKVVNYWATRLKTSSQTMNYKSLYLHNFFQSGDNLIFLWFPLLKQSRKWEINFSVFARKSIVLGVLLWLIYFVTS